MHFSGEAKLFPAVGDASGGVSWPWGVLGSGALAVLRPASCAGAKDDAALRVAEPSSLARVAKRGVFPVGGCASAVVAGPGLFSISGRGFVGHLGLAVIAPE